jgi:nitric oxide reductase NorQ protein
MTRSLKDSGLQEGASTRLLIHAGKLTRSGIPIRTACRVAITSTLSDEQEMLAAIDEIVSSVF